MAHKNQIQFKKILTFYGYIFHFERFLKWGLFLFTGRSGMFFISWDVSKVIFYKYVFMNTQFFISLKAERSHDRSS